MTKLTQFSIDINQTILDRIARRVREYRWEAVADAGGWTCGTGLSFLRELCDYWVSGYDWRAQERLLNRFPQYIANVDGIDIHFYHVKGHGNGRTIVLTHGWPGSVFEFLDIIEPLAQPERFGGNALDAFDVIVPSLPGFGFSGRLERPLGPRSIAALFAKLIIDVLGYKNYVAQGGDWGAAVSSWLGFDHANACSGVHLNMVLTYASEAPQTEEEIGWAQRLQQALQLEGAYAQLQATKPQSLAYAMLDSPVGIAAWIIEKFAAWSDLPNAADGTPDLRAVYSFDKLLTNIMFYVATDNFATSSWIYHGMLMLQDGRNFPEHRRCEVPTAVAVFPDPVFPPPPRSLVEKAYNVVQWTPMAKGGHFAAMEQPQLLINDIRNFARSIA